VYQSLSEYAHTPASKLPAIFDVLNCMEGCNVGTGCVHGHGGVNMFDVGDVMNKAKQRALQTDQGEYLKALFVEFDSRLSLPDFVRRYTPRPVRQIAYSPGVLENAFSALGKSTKSEKEFDCGACGCDTCLQMAERLAKGIDVAANCLKKAHEDAKKDHDAAVANLDRFESVLGDTVEIKNVTDTIVGDVEEINSAIASYDKMVVDIEKIAMQVNIISLNASIEAAKAGQFGKAFGVVADEIRKLAQSSDDSAKRTKEASVKASSAIKHINESVIKISKSVNGSYENVLAISESTKRLLNEQNNDDPGTERPGNFSSTGKSQVSASNPVSVTTGAGELENLLSLGDDGLAGSDYVEPSQE